MGKYSAARQSTDDTITRRMRFAPRINKATHTHSESVTNTAFSEQQCFRERGLIFGTLQYLSCLLLSSCSSGNVCDVTQLVSAYIITVALMTSFRSEQHNWPVPARTKTCTTDHFWTTQKYRRLVPAKVDVAFRNTQLNLKF